jgi:hypothetical protein
MAEAAKAYHAACPRAIEQSEKLAGFLRASLRDVAEVERL